MKPATVTNQANLLPGEEVYSILRADGASELVTVRITRIPCDDPHCIVLQLSGRAIEPDGSSRLVHGVQLEFPAHRHTVALGAIAPPPHGYTTPETIIGELKAVAFEHWPAYLTGLNAFNALPTHESVAP